MFCVSLVLDYIAPADMANSQITELFRISFLYLQKWDRISKQNEPDPLSNSYFFNLRICVSFTE